MMIRYGIELFEQKKTPDSQSRGFTKLRFIDISLETNGKFYPTVQSTALSSAI